MRFFIGLKTKHDSKDSNDKSDHMHRSNHHTTTEEEKHHVCYWIIKLRLICKDPSQYQNMIRNLQEHGWHWWKEKWWNLRRLCGAAHSRRKRGEEDEGLSVSTLLFLTLCSVLCEKNRKRIHIIVIHSPFLLLKSNVAVPRSTCHTNAHFWLCHVTCYPDLRISCSKIENLCL